MWKIENVIYGSMCGKLKMQNAVYGSMWKTENAKCNFRFNVEN